MFCAVRRFSRGFGILPKAVGTKVSAVYFLRYGLNGQRGIGYVCPENNDVTLKNVIMLDSFEFQVIHHLPLMDGAATLLSGYHAHPPAGTPRQYPRTAGYG